MSGAWRRPAVLVILLASLLGVQLGVPTPPASGAVRASCVGAVLLDHPISLNQPLSTRLQSTYNFRVRLVQTALNGSGVLTRPNCLRADGHFGPRTRTAVIGYQRAHQLRADGVVRKDMWGFVLWAVGAYGE